MTSTHEQVVKPRGPMPGTRIARCEPFPGYDGPAYILAADVPFHVTYTQTITPDGYPARERVGYMPTAPGKDVRTFLRGSLKFWGCSQAGITEDGTIFYRQTEQHAAIRFDPDPTSGLLITHPDRQVTADAYRITGHGRTPQVWSQAAVRAAITTGTPRTVIDWPEGWAHLMPDASLRFAPRGFPWEAADEYTATPVPAPDSWGPECAECGRYESEHDPKRLWAHCWSFQLPA